MVLLLSKPFSFNVFIITIQNLQIKFVVSIVLILQSLFHFSWFFEWIVLFNLVFYFASFCEKSISNFSRDSDMRDMYFPLPCQCSIKSLVYTYWEKNCELGRNEQSNWPSVDSDLTSQGGLANTECVLFSVSRKDRFSKQLAHLFICQDVPILFYIIFNGMQSTIYLFNNMLDLIRSLVKRMINHSDIL